MYPAQQLPPQQLADQVAYQTAMRTGKIIGALVALVFFVGGGVYWLRLPAADAQPASTHAAKVSKLRKERLEIDRQMRNEEEAYYKAYGDAAYKSLLDTLPDSWKPPVTTPVSAPAK